jgi:Ca2+-transporting ATPase
LILGLPIILSPIHIAFLEMIIDPVCTLAFEAETEERDVMRRPPRPPSEPLFSWPLIAWSVAQGALVFIVAAGFHVIASLRGMPADEARALTFLALVLSIGSLILVNRSFSSSLVATFRRPNPTLGWILAAVAAILALGLLLPPARGLFGFGVLQWGQLGPALGAAAFVLIALELAKAFWRGRLRF